MNMSIKAVLCKDSGWNCPYCKSDHVQAVENGVSIDDIPTDMMVCYECEKLYIVYPEWYLKGKKKQRAEYPKDISVEVSEAAKTEKERLLNFSSKRIAQKYKDLLRKDLEKGSFRFSEFVQAHPETLKLGNELNALLNVLFYADEYLSDVDIRVGIDGGKFAFKTGDNCSLSGDDLIITKMHTT